MQTRVANKLQTREIILRGTLPLQTRLSARITYYQHHYCVYQYKNDISLTPIISTAALRGFWLFDILEEGNATEEVTLRPVWVAWSRPCSRKEQCECENRYCKRHATRDHPIAICESNNNTVHEQFSSILGDGWEIFSRVRNADKPMNPATY